MNMRRATVDDADTVKRIYCHPEVFPYITDDGISPGDLDFTQILATPVAHFMIASEDDIDIGVFLFYPVNTVTYELHTAFLPGHRGDVVKRAALMAREYIWNETPCRKVVTSVPANNRQAYVMARWCGMEREGINRGSFLKHGELLDQYTMGICKEVSKCPR